MNKRRSATTAEFENLTTTFDSDVERNPSGLEHDPDGTVVAMRFRIVNRFLHDPEVLAYRSVKSTRNREIWNIIVSSCLKSSPRGPAPLGVTADDEPVQERFSSSTTIELHGRPTPTERIGSISRCVLVTLKTHVNHEAEEALRFWNGDFVHDPHPKKKIGRR